MSNLASLACLDVPAWTARIGGPTGRHARVTRSVWFNPVPWAIVAAVFTWVVLMVRQNPCWQTVVGRVPNSNAWMCYSDIPVLFQNRPNMWSNGPLYGDGLSLATPKLEYPPLTGGLIWVSRWLAGVFGAVMSPTATDAQRLAAANTFWAVSAGILAVCFGLLVWTHLQMGRDSASPHTDGVRTRAWDALLIAAAPTVMLAGLINWDMMAVALTSLGLLLWARRHPFAAGLIIGLAASAKFYPLAIVPVLLLLCLRAGRLRAWGVFAAGFAVAWLAVDLPLMIKSFDSWSYFWTYNAARGPDLGSLWYVLTLMGLPVSNVSVAEVVCLVVCGGVIVGLTLSAPRRPRIAQVALLVLVAFLAFNKVYSPQYVLWLLPLVVLARPVVMDLLVFTISESLYFFALWGFLDGVLGIGSGPDRLYWIAVGLRIGVQFWLAGHVIRDMWQPWNDPVRGPFVDDPIGGVLNHTPDAAWLLRPAVAVADEGQPAAPPVEDQAAEAQDTDAQVADAPAVEPQVAASPPAEAPPSPSEPALGTLVVVKTPRRRLGHGS